MGKCACRSGLDESDCHQSLDRFIYTSPMAPGVLGTQLLNRKQRQNVAGTLRRHGYEAFAIGTDIVIRGVHLGSLVSLAPVAGPRGWLDDGRVALAHRAQWLDKHPDEETRALDDAIEERELEAAQWLASDPKGNQLLDLYDFLQHVETLALSDDVDSSALAVDSFLARFPAGSVDVLSVSRNVFELSMYINSIRRTMHIAPEKMLEAQRAGHELSRTFSPVDVVEALLERNGAQRREAFAVKRPDSSVLFSFGAHLDLPPLAKQGLYRPRGVSPSSIGASTPVQISRLGYRADATRQYVVAALERVQAMFALLHDPLRFRTGDTLDALAWETTGRTIHRIVELTYLTQATAQPDVRRELIVSLVDLYAGFRFPHLPTMKQFETGRSWLPVSIAEAETERVRKLRATLVDEIWSGVIAKSSDGTVTLPDGRKLSPESYAERFLRHFRNSLTHGYHTDQQAAAEGSTLAVHTGEYPDSMAEFAIPMLEMLIGSAETWIKIFNRKEKRGP